MKKIIKKKEEQPVPLLDVPKSERITNQGVRTLKNDVHYVILPELRKCGYDGKLINADEVRELKGKETYFEEKHKTNPRDLFLHDASGLFLKIWKNDRESPLLIVKPFVRPRIADVTDIPRLNLQTELVKGLLTYAVPQARINAMVHSAMALKLHFLIMTETGQFWLGRFADIPEEYYFLTWRKHKEVLDRLSVKSVAHEQGQFHSCKSRLAEELKLYMFIKNSKL